jgi:Arc/MetJ family transcription regulator
VKDAGVEEYAAAIEAHLRARRGANHILSPRDFALARSWYEAGISLASVLVGIDRAFDEGAHVASLAFCRPRVEALAATGRGPAARPARPAESVPLAELQSLLAALADRLGGLRANPAAGFEPSLRKIQEVRDLLAVASRPNWNYLRGKLREIDDDVSAAVLQGVSETERTAYRDEARRAVERHRGRVDDQALEDAVGRFTIQRAREALGLPRVSLL